MQLSRIQSPIHYFRSLSLLKKYFWLYFFLLIFEGALRKWILPQYSAPLLLVRDPVAVLIIWEAVRTGKWPEKWTIVSGFLAVGLLGLCALQLVSANNSWMAAVYGLHSYLLPFPVAFIAGESLDSEDMRWFGTCTLWLLLPLTVLECAQYLASSDSILNVGAYQGATQLQYADVHIRASGTFSFVVGPAFFGPLAAAFLLYGLVSEKIAEKWLLWSSAFALMLSVPVIGSRTLVYELIGVVVCVGIAAMFGVSQFVKSFRIIVPVTLVFLLVSFLPLFSQATNTLNERFAGANETEGGSAKSAFIFRVFGPIERQLETIDLTNHPIGNGMGVGSAAISKLTRGTAEFVAGEDEFSREIYELGSVSGLAFAIFRFALAIVIVTGALARAREHEPLALLLLPLLLSTLLVGTLEQPTDQGFMVVAIAFSLAALKRRVIYIKPASVPNRVTNRVRFSQLR